MTYKDIRKNMDSGDTVACKRRSLISILIRIFTAESTNHTAICYRNDDGGMYIYEMREGKGLLITPMSQWIHKMKRDEISITYCKAPENTSAILMRHALDKLRDKDPDYSYITLIKVALSQWFNKPLNGNYVCSTSAQKIHEAGGYKGYKKLCDPGDIEEHSPFKISL